MTNAQKIRIMIVDDHEIVRRGLESYIVEDPALAVVASLGSAEDAIHACQRIQPDVVLMDIMLPGMDGVAAARQIKALYPTVKILALTGSHDAETIQEMMQAGAVGYLLKNTSMGDLHHVIHMVHAGRMTFSPEAARALLQRDVSRQQYDLTERELDVLRLMVEGLNNPEIAEKLVISRSTAGFHVSSIIAKLGATNRIEAAVIAVREHLV